ncbi:hypothetical protein ZWY2020_057606 [Hordeum vulgare]|nr:hypothetical protein ZWY2020_057606 [Hordeum vulgare]
MPAAAAAPLPPLASASSPGDSSPGVGASQTTPPATTIAGPPPLPSPCPLVILTPTCSRPVPAPRWPSPVTGPPSAPPPPRWPPRLLLTGPPRASPPSSLQQWMDPAITFFLSIRMETTVLVSGGTKVIQRSRGQRCVNPSSSRPSASRTRASSRTPSAPRTPSVNATASVNESQEHQKKTLDPVVEEALPDAPAMEDEVLYPGYVQHNNDEEDAADKEYIPAEFSDADEDEKQEDVKMGVFEDAAEDRPVEMYDRENPCIAED